MLKFLDFLQEAKLTPAMRLKKGRDARKNKAKLMRGRKKAARKAASNDVLMKRARKQARKAILDKILKGKSKNDLSAARKSELEARLSKPQIKNRINVIARKKLKDVRKADRAKFQGKK